MWEKFQRGLRIRCRKCTNFYQNTEEITQKLTQSMDNYSAKRLRKSNNLGDKIKAIRDTQRTKCFDKSQEPRSIFNKKNSGSCRISLLKIEDGWINSSKIIVPKN